MWLDQLTIEKWLHCKRRTGGCYLKLLERFVVVRAERVR